MTKSETQSIFRQMRMVVALPQSMMAFGVGDWKALVCTWAAIFAQTPCEHISAAIHRYIRDGGRYWPYPGEIAERLPNDPGIPLRDIMEGRYTSKRDAKELEERFERYGGRRI